VPKTLRGSHLETGIFYKGYQLRAADVVRGLNLEELEGVFARRNENEERFRALAPFNCVKDGYQFGLVSYRSVEAMGIIIDHNLKKHEKVGCLTANFDRYTLDSLEYIIVQLESRKKLYVEFPFAKLFFESNDGVVNDFLKMLWGGGIINFAIIGKDKKMACAKICQTRHRENSYHVQTTDFSLSIQLGIVVMRPI